MIKRLRNYFLTGLLVLMPSVLTVMIFWKLFLFIDNLLGNSFGDWISITLFGHRILGVGFLFVILLVLITGIIARNILGRTLIHWGELVINRLPIIRNIYRAIQQISQAFLADHRDFFKTPILIEYPREGVYTIAFLTSERQAVPIAGGVQTVSVFIPTTPNPTSGFFLMLPKNEVTRLDMSVEDAMKLIISGGVVRLDPEPDERT